MTRGVVAALARPRPAPHLRSVVALARRRTSGQSKPANAHVVHLRASPRAQSSTQAPQVMRGRACLCLTWRPAGADRPSKTT